MAKSVHPIDSTIYTRQFDRIVKHAAQVKTTEAAMSVGIARMVMRTQPKPVGSTKFTIMTLSPRDGEILPRYRSRPFGGSIRSTWSDITKRETYQGPVATEQALVEVPHAIAVPNEMLNKMEIFSKAESFKLTPSSTLTVRDLGIGLR